MNSVFAALATVAFGLMLIGADVSAAPQPSHPAPARKAAQAAKPAAKAVTQKPAQKDKGVRSTKAAVKAAAAPRDARNRPGRGENAARATASGKQVSREVRRGAKTVQAQEGRRAVRARAGKEGRTDAVVVESGKPSRVSRDRRGRKLVVEEQPRAAQGRDPRGSRPVELRNRPADRAMAVQPVTPPANRSGGGIGREAFVPSGAPLPRDEALRQLRARASGPALPVVQPAQQARQTITLPSPPPVSRPAAGLAEPPGGAAARQVAEAPRPVARNFAPVTELSGPEAAAAAAAAISAPRVVEAARAPVPVAPSAPLVSSPPAVAPAPAAVSAPAVPAAAVQAPQPSRPARGMARAYAMDGASFYQGGRKIRVQGLDARDPGMTSEHATQRLQRALDAGTVIVEPVEVDGSGHTIAVVRVNGRNVADAVRGSGN